MKIISKEKNVFGKWEVRIFIGKDYGFYLNFDTDPSEDTIKYRVYMYLSGLEETTFESTKTDFLKILENEYYDFITNEWNGVLHEVGITPPDYMVTIDNTDESTNVRYLLYLKRLNKQYYYNMAGEFDRYKRLILDNDGVMSRVKQH